MLLQAQPTVRSTRLAQSVLQQRGPSPFPVFNHSRSTFKPISRMFALTPYKRDQTKTFDRQRELPRLPIPPLDKSLERYITSLKPLLLEQALKSGQGQQQVEQELEKRRQWAQDFQSKDGLGRLLQERLKGEYADDSRAK